MRVTSIELHPEGSSDVHVLSFRDPTRQNPYNVVSISGLDADSITSKYYGVSGSSAAKFYSPSLEKREPVFKIQLNPSFSQAKTYSDLRDDLYKVIGASRTGLVQVQFKNETGIVAVISGWPTKFESDPFEQTPTVLLTIKTNDPMLKAPNPVNVDVDEFDLSDVNIQDLVSTAPHGFNFVMTFAASRASIIIGDPTDSSWNFTVSPSGGFLTSDALHFSSEPNDKQLYLVRGGVITYLADKILSGSFWPIMFHGDNHFNAVSPENITLTSISYYPTFWGV